MLDVIIKRRSIRNYTPHPVEDDKLQEILKAVQFSPTARHTRAWEFIVVKDKDLIQKLSQIKFHAKHAGLAPVVLVLCSKDFPYWIEDLAIVCEAVYLETTNQGLGTCMIQMHNSKTSGGEDAEKEVKKILQIPSGIHVLGFMPIGYPNENPQVHTDKDFDAHKVHINKW